MVFDADTLPPAPSRAAAFLRGARRCAMRDAAFSAAPVDTPPPCRRSARRYAITPSGCSIFHFHAAIIAVISLISLFFFFFFSFFAFTIFIAFSLIFATFLFRCHYFRRHFIFAADFSFFAIVFFAAFAAGFLHYRLRRFIADLAAIRHAPFSFHADIMLRAVDYRNCRLITLPPAARAMPGAPACHVPR
jgi:hypothetical protein